MLKLAARLMQQPSMRRPFEARLFEIPLARHLVRPEEPPRRRCDIGERRHESARRSLWALGGRRWLAVGQRTRFVVDGRRCRTAQFLPRGYRSTSMQSAPIADAVDVRVLRTEWPTVDFRVEVSAATEAKRGYSGKVLIWLSASNTNYRNEGCLVVTFSRICYLPVPGHPSPLNTLVGVGQPPASEERASPIVRSGRIVPSNLMPISQYVSSRRLQSLDLTS